jgi:hypothetical protein
MSTNLVPNTILGPKQLHHLECINQAWQKSLEGWRDSVEGIIATGKALATAQTELEPDEYRILAKDEQFPFSKRMVQMLVKVAKHPVLSDEACFASLPPTWGTLHALTQLPTNNLKRGLADGTINPKMERKNIIKLKPRDDTIEPAIPKPKPTPEEQMLAMLDDGDAGQLVWCL